MTTPTKIVFHVVNGSYTNILERMVSFAQTQQPWTPYTGEKVAARCKVQLGSDPDPAASIYAYVVGDVVCIVPALSENTLYFDTGWRIEEVEPFVTLDLLSEVFEKTEEVDEYLLGGYGRRHKVLRPMSYDRGWDHYKQSHIQGIPWNFVHVRARVGEVTVEGELALKRPLTGKVTYLEGIREIQVETTFLGKPFRWQQNLLTGTSRYDKHGLQQLAVHLKHGVVEDPDRIWLLVLQYNTPGAVDTSSIKSVATRKTIAPNLERLKKEEPVLHALYLWLHEGKTRDKQKNNTLLAKFLTEVGADYALLCEGLRKAKDALVEFACDLPSPSYHLSPNEIMTRYTCLTLPGAQEYQQEKAAKADWKMRTDKASQAEGLGVSPESHPLLHAAIVEGKIPTTVFYQPSKEPVNVEFTIWEKALARKGWADVIYEIAQSAARRSTYERDITPYLNFMFRLERYLDRNTEGRKKWSCMPKFVNSQWELEMDEANEEGTVKRRSALTPVADNETRTVTVPYAAMAISGVHTTWCYSQYYHVFEEGMQDPVSNGIVPSDVVEKLNGRDDYGLCYYTLTGTSRNQGYPTFLIIFERRVTGTFVHFHRVHPKRTVDGVNTPACQLVERCYQYMAGNIPAAEITAQQGDMIFIHKPDASNVDKKTSVAEPSEVNEFESHRFVPPEGSEKQSVSLYRSTAKSVGNRLGYVYTETGFAVRHPEHDDIEHIPAGWVEVRRCKSWEANPTAVWSFTID